jgi:hypothetical protein
LREAEAELLPWLDLPPQTNEVARSAVLTAGLAVVAAETGLPLSLYELGASAGLNMLLDRYDIRLGSRRYGDPASAVKLAPDWEGADPPEADVRVAERHGVDMSPIDVGDESARERLLAYVWPDQQLRKQRLEAALSIAANAPPCVAKGDAADWIEAELLVDHQPGIVRVVLHSIAFQYFPADTQDRVARHIGQVAASARPNAPLAWLRYELEDVGAAPTLRLRIWPGGEDRLLAHVDPHGRRVEWLT